MKEKMLYSIAITLLAIQFGYSYELNENCLQGPKYWCKSIEKANECNAFKHCLQTVWSTHNRYLVEDRNVNLAVPNQCTNCIQCLTADHRRCPYIRLYQDEINQLLANNIGRKPICQLLKQCDESIQQQEQSKSQEINTIEDLNEDKRFKCGIHPRNWCNTIETARKCNAVDFCLINWKNSNVKYELKESQKSSSLEIKENDSRICGFCVFVFGKIQAVLQQNSTEEAILNYLEGSCNLLPQQDMVQNCLNDIDKYLPEIYNMVRNNVDPGIICRVLKACRDEHLIEVKQLDSKKNEKEVIDQVISSLRGIKIQVKNTSPQTNGDLLSRLEPKLSKSMGVACELCEIVLTSAKYMIQNKINQEKVLTFIENQLCSRLGNLNQTCVQYIKEEGATILNLLIHDVDPAIVCKAMGLCSKVQVSDEYIRDKFFDLNVRNKVNCTLCKMVVENVKKQLEEKQSQAIIIEYINKNLCEKAGNSRELCKTLIDAYAPLFFEIIAKDINATQLCEMIGMCEAVKTVRPMIPITIIEKPQEKVNTTCVVCEFVISVLAKYVKSNATEAEIEQMLNVVCEKAMPNSIKQECSTFVSQYGPIIAALLAKQIEPEKVCTMINLCPSHQNQNTAIRIGNKVYYSTENLYKLPRNQQKKETQEPVTCAVCEFIIKYALAESKLEQTEKVIEFSVNNICRITPRRYKAQCENIVEKNGARLVELMNKYSDPTKICQIINVCPKEDQESKIAYSDIMNIKFIQPKIEHKVHLDDNSIKVKTGNNSVECSLCLYVAQLANQMLKNNKTEEQIIAELDLVCNLFPSNIKDQCVAFINEYAPYVIQLVAEELDPQMTCISLNLCDKPNTKRSLRFFLDKL